MVKETHAGEADIALPPQPGDECCNSAYEQMVVRFKTVAVTLIAALTLNPTLNPTLTLTSPNTLVVALHTATIGHQTSMHEH